MSPTEAELHRRFLQLFTTHEESVRAFVRRLVPARADADDVMQEVCVVLWEKFGTFHEGADFRAPLGRAIIGGVITSTILTLVVIPTMYEILDDWRLRLKGMFKIPERPKTEEYMIPRELRESAPKASH